MQETQNLGLTLERQPSQLINIREASGGDTGWIGKLILGDKAFPFRGWSSHVRQLSAVCAIRLGLLVAWDIYKDGIIQSQHACDNDAVVQGWTPRRKPEQDHRS